MYDLFSHCLVGVTTAPVLVARLGVAHVTGLFLCAGWVASGAYLWESARDSAKNATKFDASSSSGAALCALCVAWLGSGGNVQRKGESSSFSFFVKELAGCKRIGEGLSRIRARGAPWVRSLFITRGGRASVVAATYLTYKVFEEYFWTPRVYRQRTHTATEDKSRKEGRSFFDIPSDFMMNYTPQERVIDMDPFEPKYRQVTPQLHDWGVSGGILVGILYNTLIMGLRRDREKINLLFRSLT